MGTDGGSWTSLLTLREAVLWESFTDVGLLGGEGAQTMCHVFVKRCLISGRVLTLAEARCGSPYMVAEQACS